MAIAKCIFFCIHGEESRRRRRRPLQLHYYDMTLFVLQWEKALSDFYRIMENEDDEDERRRHEKLAGSVDVDNDKHSERIFI